jgi:hypothetical protein
MTYTLMLACRAGIALAGKRSKIFLRAAGRARIAGVNP